LGWDSLSDGVSRYLTTASSEFEANIIEDRLSAAGIRVLVEGYAARGNVPGSGARDIYVDDPDLDRAREALGEAEGRTQPTEPKGTDRDGGRAR
jgi:hypothetical protein